MTLTAHRSLLQIGILEKDEFIPIPVHELVHRCEQGQRGSLYIFATIIPAKSFFRMEAVIWESRDSYRTNVSTTWYVIRNIFDSECI